MNLNLFFFVFHLMLSVYFHHGLKGSNSLNISNVKCIIYQLHNNNNIFLDNEIFCKNSLKIFYGVYLSQLPLTFWTEEIVNCSCFCVIFHNYKQNWCNSWPYLYKNTYTFKEEICDNLGYCLLVIASIIFFSFSILYNLDSSHFQHTLLEFR